MLKEVVSKFCKIENKTDLYLITFVVGVALAIILSYVTKSIPIGVPLGILLSFIVMFLKDGIGRNIKSNRA